MTLAQAVLVATVILVGLPASFKNWTAFGLVLSWGFMESMWQWTGQVSPTSHYILADMTAMTIMYMKPPAYDCFPYRSFRHQMECLWLERSWWDRAVIVGFLCAWTVYATVSPNARWWPLWAIAIFQFLAAGGEALQSWQKAKSAGAGSDTPSSGPVVFRVGWGQAGVR